MGMVCGAASGSASCRTVERSYQNPRLHTGLTFTLIGPHPQIEPAAWRAFTAATMSSSSVGSHFAQRAHSYHENEGSTIGVAQDSGQLMPMVDELVRGSIPQFQTQSTARDFASHFHEQCTSRIETCRSAIIGVTWCHCSREILVLGLDITQRWRHERRLDSGC